MVRMTHTPSEAFIMIMDQRRRAKPFRKINSSDWLGGARQNYDYLSAQGGLARSQEVSQSSDAPLVSCGFQKKLKSVLRDLKRFLYEVLSGEGQKSPRLRRSCLVSCRFRKSWNKAISSASFVSSNWLLKSELKFVAFEKASLNFVWKTTSISPLQEQIPPFLRRVDFWNSLTISFLILVLVLDAQEEGE